MADSMQNEKTALYSRLFRGRDDAFAKRSVKTGQYFPEYTLDWDEFREHRAKGGSMATFKS